MDSDLLSVELCSGFGQWHSPNNERDPKQYTSTTLDQIRAMLENPPVVQKDQAQWAIFSTLASRVHSEQRENGRFYALWADIDDNSAQNAEQVFNLLHILLPGFVAYTSRSATEQNQKLRILVPLTEPVTGSDFVRLQKVLNDKLENAGVMPDRVTERAGQVCYLPNKGRFWCWDEKQGAFDPTLWADDLAELIRQEKAETEAKEQRQEQARQKAAQRMASGCQSPIDAYNETYPLDLTLSMFGYTKRGKKWLSPNSESGVPGVTISADGRKWFSQHGSDSAIGQQTETGTMGDSFDLFVYYQHGSDRDAAIREAGRMFTTDEGITITKASQRDYAQQQSINAAPEQIAGEQQTSEATDRPGFVFSPIAGMLTNLRPPQWIVKGVIERDSLAMLYGEPGSAKSFLAMDIAASIATGRDWHGHRCDKGAVFYIAGEGANGIARRFKAWELAHSTDLTTAPLAVSTKPVALDDPQAARSVQQAIVELSEVLGQPPALIVVDTLARNFAGDENSTRDMNLFIRCMDGLRHKWQASILIVHHTGKDTSKGARGSSVLKAAIDTEYSATMDENKVICLQAHKMKEAELPRPLAFKLEGVKLPITDDEGNDIWSCAPALLEGNYQPPKTGARGRGKNQTKALQCLKELYQEHEQRLAQGNKDPAAAMVQISDWRTRCIENGLQRQRFNETQTSLADLGFITLTPPFVELAA